jgi:hypothetical protein
MYQPKGKINDKLDKAISANTNKPSTSNPVVNNTELNAIVNNSKKCDPKSRQTMNNPNTHALDYNVIEDVKNTKANISMLDICSLQQQRDLIHDAFNPDNTQKNIVANADNILPNEELHEVHKVEIATAINATGIGA